MVKIRQYRRLIFFTGIIAALFLLLGGCSGSSRKSGQRSFFSRVMGKEAKSYSPLYYEFDDVLVPGELKRDKKLTFIFQTPSITAGVLSLKGMVDMNSLIAFFENNMPKDHWKPVSSFSAPRTIMLFQKESRWCVISISETDFITRAEIWVAPTTPASGFSEGLLK